MRVLIACEFSGIVRNAFVAAGHDAMSCDLLPSETERPDGWDGHYQGDVCDLLADPSYEFDLMIAHPPCTHLASSGARWFKDKLADQSEAIEFVRLLSPPRRLRRSRLRTRSASCPLAGASQTKSFSRGNLGMARSRQPVFG